MKFELEYDRHPGRKVWLGSFEDMTSGLRIRARVKMKPILLQLGEERWLRIDAAEIIAIEKSADGRGIWHTLRGSFHDLVSDQYERSVEKANRVGVFVEVSSTFAISPHRIVGIRLTRDESHQLELEGRDGEPMIVALDPPRLALVEECLEAINLGGGFLITGPDDDE